MQIKRPDPHPPEHEQPGQSRPPEEEAETLVSEVAACPFCVTPEFGVSYDPPPFRRGLAYANQANRNPFLAPTSAMSSSTSLTSVPGRRRATSLSVNAPQVITTDRVRPDWAMKLADARAHALRRSAAATALHNAAYVLGNQGDGLGRGGLAGFGRRRRTLFGDSPGASGSGTPGGQDGMILSRYGYMIPAGSATDRGEGEDGSGDLFPARGSSRRNRVDDLEDLMMMEAIRLSLAAEDDRKNKEEKELRKEAKKRAKDEKKAAKQAEKMAKKGGGGSAMYRAGTNDSASTWASTSMARSTSNLGMQPSSIPEEQVQGKGKAPVQDFAGFNLLSEPSSTLNAEMKEPREDDGTEAMPPTGSSLSTETSQRHLEESSAHLQPATAMSMPIPSQPSQHTHELSNASSAASSFVDSAPGSLRADSNLPSVGASDLDVSTAAHESTPTQQRGTPPSGSTSNLEPMLNFRSLAAMIGEEEDGGKSREVEHVEHASSSHVEDEAAPAISTAEVELKEPSPTGSPHVSPTASADGAGVNRSRGDSGESTSSAPPPIYVERPPIEEDDGGGDEIRPAPPQSHGIVHHDVDTKDIERVDVLGQGHHAHEATQ